MFDSVIDPVIAVRRLGSCTPQLTVTNLSRIRAGLLVFWVKLLDISYGPTFRLILSADSISNLSGSSVVYSVPCSATLVSILAATTAVLQNLFALFSSLLPNFV